MAKSREHKSAEIAGKLPPQNLEAEMSLLGAVLIDEDVLTNVSDKIRPDDFYDKRHALIYTSR